MEISCGQKWDGGTNSHTKYTARQFRNETGILMQRVNGGELNAGEICCP